MTTRKWKIHPLRSIYIGMLCLVAFHIGGWMAVLLVGLASVDIELIR